MHCIVVCKCKNALKLVNLMNLFRKISNKKVSKQVNQICFFLLSLVFLNLHCTHFDYCNIFVLYDIYEALKWISTKIFLEIHFNSVLD